MKASRVSIKNQLLRHDIKRGLSGSLIGVQQSQRDSGRVAPALPNKVDLRYLQKPPNLLV